MRCLEIVCVTTTAVEREAVISAVAPYCDEPEVDVRIYRHEMHPTYLAVHLTHRGEGQDRADALAERIAALLNTHGFISRARWREVATPDTGTER